ncbi:MAG: stage VI sporulation protein F [Coprobacillus sp.]
MIKLDKHDKLLDKVSSKTNVSKQDILGLASDLQSKDLNNEDNIKDFVNKIAKMTNKQVKPEQMNKIISVIKNNQVPKDIDKFV